MLVNSGIRLIKYYLDISKGEQVQHLADRKSDPLEQWKVSPVDAVAVKHWSAYPEARDAMLSRTHTAIAPWRIVHRQQAAGAAESDAQYPFPSPLRREKYKARAARSGRSLRRPVTSYPVLISLFHKELSS